MLTDDNDLAAERANRLAAERMFLRMWTQGIIANYSSVNVNGSHEIIGVVENGNFTDVTMRSHYPFTIFGPNGKPYKCQTCTVHVTVTCDSVEIDER